MIMRIINTLDALSEVLWDFWNRRQIEKMKKLSGKTLDRKYGENRKLRS